MCRVLGVDAGAEDGDEPFLFGDFAAFEAAGYLAEHSPRHARAARFLREQDEGDGGGRALGISALSRAVDAVGNEAQEGAPSPAERARASSSGRDFLLGYAGGLAPEPSLAPPSTGDVARVASRYGFIASFRPAGLSTPATAALDRKLAEDYAERQRLQQAWKKAKPDLRHLPMLERLLRLVGLLPLTRGNGKGAQRACAVLFFCVQLSPYVPMLVLRRCSNDEPTEGADCSSFTTWDAYRLVNDALFLGAVLFGLGAELVVTLHHSERKCSPAVRRERQSIMRSWVTGLLLSYGLFWTVLPTFDLLRAVLPKYVVSYHLSRGDLAVRVLWLIAGPFRAAFMASLMTCLVLVISSVRPDLKAIRAAAALLGHRGAELDTREVLAQVSALVRRYSQLAMAVQQASDRVQVLLAFLLIFSLNVLFQTCLMITIKLDMSAAHTDEWAHYTNICHNIVFASVALAVFGMAAHVTSLCDKTMRSLLHASNLHMAAYLHKWDDLSVPGTADGARVRDLDQCLLQAMQFMQQTLIGAQGTGGFRIAGQRISFSLFVVLVTLAVAASNIISVLHSVH